MMNRDIIKSPHEQKLCDEWETQPLRKISTIVGGGTPRRSKVEFWENGNIPWLVPSEISSGNATFIHDTEEHINQRGLSSSSAKLMPAGSVLMTSRATIGECIINTVPMATNQGFSNFICDEDVLDNLFLLYQLRYRKKQLISLAEGTTIKGITRRDVKRFSIPLPPLPEQKKIAAILSSVDEAIQKTDEVIEQTKQLKKGLMQELLTRGIGHSEFEEVRIGPRIFMLPRTWIVVSLGTVTRKFYSGGTPSTGVAEYWGGSIPWTTGAYTEHTLTNGCKGWITKEGLVNSATNLVPRNNILLCTRTDVGKVSRNAFDIAISQDLTGIELDSSRIHTDFAVWSLTYYRNLLRSYEQGTTIKGILRRDVEIFEMPLPPLKEQEMIIYILSSVDEKIKKEQDYKSQLQLLKKGLMQVLLTGKVRVKID